MGLTMSELVYPSNMVLYKPTLTHHEKLYYPKKLSNYFQQYRQQKQRRKRHFLWDNILLLSRDSNLIKRLLLLLAFVCSFNHCVNGYYNVDSELRNPLRVAYRGNTASFVCNNTLYFYGGDGGRRTNADFSDPISGFESLRLDPSDGSIIYSTVPDKSIPKYSNYSSYARAVLLPDNERVLIVGGMRSIDLTQMGNIISRSNRSIFTCCYLG
ncbi:hypothetical protein BDA99DRAFT_538764 [Phascolomyces articulosus]|uniref:Kelch repeat protein n=1 Tax=Phascolomyces articulosus TaxID=60185 RepID=A0AAD5K6S7_9FUNG|nr:hypothetical protein BDA99DRAFT_538764 [Phascolomyces articulosus]